MAAEQRPVKENPFSQLSIKKGLGRTLFYCFLAMSLLPLAIVSKLNYENARKFLHDSAEDSLVASIRLKKDRIDAYLAKRLSTLQVQANIHSNIEFLKALKQAFKKSGLPLGAFVKSDDWRHIVQRYGVDLKILQTLDRYYDIMLIDKSGNVLFSIQEGQDLGTNVFKDVESNLYNACNRAFVTNKPVGSDIELYGGYGKDRYVNFLVQAMKQPAGEVIGFLVFGLPFHVLDEVMVDSTTLGETGETYLIASDLIMRSNSRFGGGSQVLRQKIKSTAAQKWLESLPRNNHANPPTGSGQNLISPSEPASFADKPEVIKTLHFSDTYTYTNYRGDVVLGLYHDLASFHDIGLDWAIIAEITADEAYSPANQLKNITLLYMLATAGIVVLLSGFLAGYIVWPVRRLSRWARQVANGDLSYEDIQTPANEIGEMNQSFRDVVDAFRSVADVCEAIARGDLTKSIDIKGEKDHLGRSIRQMEENLREIVGQADRIAEGDYTTQISLRSDKDVLGNALINMTDRLRNVTEQNARALQEARQLINNLDSLPSPVLTMNPDFTITYINPAGAAVAGLSRSDCIGAKCQALFRSELCHTRMCPAERVKRGEGLVKGMNRIDPDDLNLPVEFTAASITNRDNTVAGMLVHMNDISKREQAMTEIRDREWLHAGQVGISDVLRGVYSLTELCRNSICFLADYLECVVGALYLVEDEGLVRYATYACPKDELLAPKIAIGEGLVGQCALDKTLKIIDNVPGNYFFIQSSLGKSVPSSLALVPLMFGGEIYGVAELGYAKKIPHLHLEFLRQIAEYVAIAISAARSRMRLTELLEETRKQAEQLRRQQEELRRANEELAEQTKALTISEEELQSQQEELRVTNEELEERTRALEAQKESIRRKHEELEEVRKGLENKTRDLETANNYKSQFLANMSHELRTPLNSMLLLSKILAANKEGNLSARQVEFAATIHGAGTGLLKLINEILDLSKVESGKISLAIAEIDVRLFVEDIRHFFTQIADGKGVPFEVNVTKSVPQTITSDRLRIEQILRNFLSNAFKFTEEGKVSFNVRLKRNFLPASATTDHTEPQEAVVFSISDTGIGIPLSKQDLIFEEFQQADGTTTRKYGGTGLGLSISKKLAEVLGGEIAVKSVVGRGSTFTLIVPVKYSGRIVAEDTDAEWGDEHESPVVLDTPAGTETDDRDEIGEEDRVLLIIEDDPEFNRILKEFANQKGFKVLLAKDGQTGLWLAQSYKPHAIMLDIGLPVVNGMEVMKLIKENNQTRHIPVHFISGKDKALEALKMGAIGYLTKPVSRRELNRAMNTIENAISKNIRKVLVAEDSGSLSGNLAGLIEGQDVEITAVASGHDAFLHLKSGVFDCLILDLDLADQTAFELLEQMAREEAISHTPTILYTERTLNKKELARLNEMENIVMKKAHSTDALLDEAALFLHRVEENLPLKKSRQNVGQDKSSLFTDKKILIVDDDMRNVFAVTSLLEERGVQVVVAKNGREGLDRLAENPDIDLILMDILLPEMDGYQVMKQIRGMEKFHKIPIIALTAKAMKGDRKKCIDAGADDYMTKPINDDKFLSLLQVWLYK